MHRREFIKTIAAAGAMSLIDPKNPLAGRTIASPGYFGIHQFIETHPNAVFIKRTNVAYKTDSGAKKQEGLELAREIFILRHTPGIPLSHKFAIKPNITWAGGMANTERGMTIITDWNFVEGMIEGIKELGILAEQIYIREGGWTRGAWTEERLSTPYIGVAERTGVHLFDFPTGREIHELTVETAEEGTEVTWSDFPEGIVFRRIPHVAPLNEPDAWLLNISKFKTHGMGMTLCTKNLQGASMRPHLEFCEGVDTTKQQPEHIFNDFQPDLEEHVEQLHAQHLAAGVPRWDRPGRTCHSGYGMEMWAQRTCDSVSAIDVGLNIIEGISGQNGNGFLRGPGPNGEAESFMTNILIFGRNPFLVDIVGHWLGGHEPGNFGMFHIAKERGLCNTINPMSIPVYLWENGVPQLTPLTEFDRTPLVTYYLQRNYGGQNEPYYHLVDEYYSYEGDPCVVNLSEGWNMVSCSGDPVVNDIPTLLSGKPVLPFCYTWDPDRPNYRPASTIEFGKAYWLYATQDTQLTIQCRPRDILVSQLRAGWNMLGSVNGNADLLDPQDTPDGSVLLPVYTYDPESYSYQGQTDINTGQGCWILALQNCILNVSSSDLTGSE